MRVLLTGAAGFLGRAAARRLSRDHEVVAVTRRGEPLPGCAGADRWDLADPGSAQALVERAAPDAVLHLAAVSKLEPCEADPAGTRRVNVDAAAALARAAAARGALFHFASSEQVHAGDAAPYGDAAVPRPVHEYGRQKAEAEAAVLAAGGRTLCLRVSLCFGLPEAGSPENFCSVLLRELREGRAVRGYADQKRSYLHVEDAAELFARALERGLPPGGGKTLNFSGSETMDRHLFAVRFARALGLPPSLVLPALSDAAGLVRPKDLTMDARALYAWTGFTPAPVAEGLSRLARGLK